MIEMLYDPEANALAVSFRQGGRSVRTVAVSETVNVDFDSKGRLVGLEVLEVRSHMDTKTLTALPASRWLTLAEAERESGLRASTLRVLINRDRLTGQKRGRDWLVAATALYKYMDSREARGRQATNPRARRRSADRQRA